MTGSVVGFVLPFLAAGLFAGSVLFHFRRRRGAVRWTSFVSGALAILMGVLILTGAMSSRSGLIAAASAEDAQTAESATDTSASESGEDAGEEDEVEPVMAPDFTLTDQNGETHTLSSYQGKVVFLNFWATWCPFCIEEMPSIEELYHELGENTQDVVILGVCAPGTYDTADEAGILAFIEEHGWTYPMLMDLTGEVFGTYVSGSLPTTWLIRTDGNIMGYMPGAMTKENMLYLIQLTQQEQ